MFQFSFAAVAVAAAMLISATADSSELERSLTFKAERAKTLLGDFDAIVQTGLKEFQVPGLAIGIIADGQLVYAKAFGEREMETGLPVTMDTLFPIGSCTKAFAAFALGGLVEEGKLEWDQPVIDTLQEFRLFDAYATQNLTIRDLLSHRSGLPRHDVMWYNSDWSSQDVLARLRFLEPTCDIRERFNYNNLMYLVLGELIERSAAASWEEVVRAKILCPLGMSKTGFNIQEMQSSPNHAFPYVGKEGQVNRMAFCDISLIGPAGSMYSNIADMCRWMQLQIDDGVFEGKPLIGLATLKEMHSPQIVVSGYPESKEARISAYGLGWCVQTYRGIYNISHDGGLNGFTSLVSILPEEQIGIVILCNKNLSPLPRILGMHAFDRLLELPSINWMAEGIEGVKKNREAMMESKKSEALNRKKGTVPSHPLDEFQGIYEHPGYGQIEVSVEEGMIHAKYNNIVYKLSHWHYDVFSVESLSEDVLVPREGLKFSFTANLNGDIDTLIIPFESNAPDIVFKRKPEERHESLAYLRQFAGVYEIYGYTVDIVVKNHTLFSIIPGQPTYELIPAGENEFTIKSQTGYLVRFVMSPMGEVEEVLLIQPYGIVFSAKPKRPI